MDDLRKWRTYDTVKLVIAIILLSVLIWFMFAPDPDPEKITASPTKTPLKITNTSGLIQPPTETLASPPISSTPTPSTTVTPTSTATHTPTLTATATTTSTATSSPTPTLTATTTSTATVTASLDACSLALQSRLEVGMTAIVRTNLNLRASPGMDQEIMLVHLPGIRLEIIGGPVCIPYLDGAYRWWQVQRPDGQIGWSAEGSLNRFYYFMEP